jgi:hypothetical protein
LGGAAASDYASLPPEPRMQKDLKKFPLQTYPSQSLSTIADWDDEENKGSAAAATERKEQNVIYGSSRHKMRHQMSERTMVRSKFAADTPDAVAALHHSKSVPNLIGPNDELGQEELETYATGGEQSFSFLDPDKRLRVTDNTLKLIQKQALLDYYERRSATSSNRRKSTASSGGSQGKPEPPDSGFYSPTEKNAVVDALARERKEDDSFKHTNVEVHRQQHFADDQHEDGFSQQDQVGIKRKEMELTLNIATIR